jgi:hypothetical protein
MQMPKHLRGRSRSAYKFHISWETAHLRTAYLHLKFQLCIDLHFRAAAADAIDHHRCEVADCLIAAAAACCLMMVMMTSQLQLSPVKRD